MTTPWSIKCYCTVILWVDVLKSLTLDAKNAALEFSAIGSEVGSEALRERSAPVRIVEHGRQQRSDSNPVFTWANDSSEDGYDISVFDSFGNEIWTDEIGPVTGSTTVAHTYAGPALESGTFYQFKATSFRDKNGQRTAISTTEDLKGVLQLVAAP